MGTMLRNGQTHQARAIGGGGDSAGRCTRELSEVLGMFWILTGL